MEAKNISKVIYKDSSIIFLNRLLLSLSRVVTTYIFAHRLSIEVYGAYQNFWIQLGTLFAVAGLSLSSFVFSYNSEKIIQIFRNLSRKNYLIGSLIVLSCGLLFGWMQHKTEVGFGLAFLFLLWHTLSIVLDNVLTAFKKFRFLLVINAGYFLLFVSVHLYVLQRPSYHFSLLILLLLALVSIKSLLIILKLKGILKEQSPHDSLEDKSFLRFWRHLYFFEAVQMFWGGVDKFAVSLIAPATISAIYQNATYTIPLLAIVFSAVSSAVFLQFSDINGGLKREAEILKSSGKIFAIVAIPLFFLLMAFSKEFITLVFSAKYLSSVPIFRMSLLSVPFSIFNYLILFQRHEKGFIINKGMFIDIVGSIILAIPLYLWLGLKGIPLAIAISTLFQCLFYLRQHKKILQADYATFLPFRDWIIKTITFGLVIFSLKYCFTELLSFPLIWGLFITAAIVGILMFLFIVKETKLFRR